jgi:uncharacterized protein YndB with AHSA1/START domain
MMNVLTMTARGDLDIVMTREFEAPRHLVWEAWTRPELLRRWLLGPPGWEMVVCDMDVRVGGRYRWEWRRPSTGDQLGAGGVYREVAPPARLAWTERFDDPWYEGEAISTLELEDLGGRTRLVNVMSCATRETRDTVLASGMDTGVAHSYDLLDELLSGAAVPAATS